MERRSQNIWLGMYPCLELRTADTVNCNAAIITDHTGTHCDAPCHVLPDGKSIDQLPVDLPHILPKPRKKIKATGIDLGGPDPLGGSKHICHEILLSNDVYIIESLCNLDQIVGKEVTFLAFPLKFEGFSGAPTRAVAMLEKTE